LDDEMRLDLSSKPESVDMPWWERFVEFRGRKVASEASLQEEAWKLALMRKELALADAEDAQLAQSVSTLMAQHGELRAKRKQLMHDMDIQLHLKAGQVSQGGMRVVRVVVWKHGVAGGYSQQDHALCAQKKERIHTLGGAGRKHKT
jgi:hypothetical protein